MQKRISRPSAAPVPEPLLLTEKVISAIMGIWTDFNTYLPNTNVCIKAFTNGKITENVPAAGSDGKDISCESYSAEELKERGFLLNPAYEDGSSDMVSSVSTGNASSASCPCTSCRL